jgi:hypothetical protein
VEVIIMRAIKINSYNETIEEIEINGLADMQKHVEGYIEAGFYFPDGSCCFVDEEGLLKQTPVFFEIKGAHQPFAGNGLIVGAADENGATTPCTLNIDYVKKMTRFYDLLSLQIYLAHKKHRSN